MSKSGLLNGLLNKLLVISVAGLASIATVKYSGILDEVGDQVNEYYTNPKYAKGLKRFTAFWVPMVLKGKYKPSEWVLGLVYIEEDNIIGEFEGPGEYYKIKNRWLKIETFDYDEATGVLTIDFDKNNVNAQGIATFQITDEDHLLMTNSGGTYEFFRATDENMKPDQVNTEILVPNNGRHPYEKLIPPGDTR